MTSSETLFYSDPKCCSKTNKFDNNITLHMKYIVLTTNIEVYIGIWQYR